VIFGRDFCFLGNRQDTFYICAAVESVIADAGEKGQQALNCAGQKGHEAMDNAREVGDALAVEMSVTKRPYATLALALGLGFLLGATWRR
jgi:ElaB/YqjD/DUF883 family membrane-anchored ribosome-binding protein